MQPPIGAYGNFNGLLLPSEVTALWRLASGDATYIKGRVTEIEYNRPEMY